VWTELDRLVERFAESYPKLERKLKSASMDRTADILRKHLEVRGPTGNLGYTFGENDTLGRALDLDRVYLDRDASDEQATVKQICLDEV